MILQEADLNKSYQVVSINLPEASLRHLSNLGLKVDTTLKVLSKTKSSAIILLKSNRLAFDTSILANIDVADLAEEEEILPLSELEVGQSAYIENIYALNEAKRRLMDMGLTKHTKIYLRKVAPLGDPIEISLRGYELTLRKSEAQMVSVVIIKDQKGDRE